ncbi:apolipoprotein N-acyltransferase [Legionella sp. W05-934-2]|uniref:apolipoprotein N-acyltransferase n=1 Tax=Legionella sp. W05-934-2 TaxID=1198649 RepID=UPI0034632FAC
MQFTLGKVKRGIFEAVPLIIAGLLLPLSFSPFHLSGFAFLSLAWLIVRLDKKINPFTSGFIFGLAFFGFGISWIYNSIHQFGHLPPLIAFMVTSLFVAYLAIYPAITSWLYLKLKQPFASPLFYSALFATLWTMSEWLRGHLFTGFPWLQVGFGQIDSPLGKLIPIIGVYGTTFLVVFIGGLVASLFTYKGLKRMGVQIFLVIFLLGLHQWQPKPWTTLIDKPMSVGVVQANLSMRDKWDESYFWRLISHYQKAIYQLLGKDLIILPESAIPVPAEMIAEEMNAFDSVTKKFGSALLVGIPQEDEQTEQQRYYNSLTVLGQGEGIYRKQQLVPFGEYLPKPFQFLNHWAPLASANMLPGDNKQSLPLAKRRPFATLICYELAYDHLLRKQLPDAQWLVSISDDGWFGYSLAPFQQQQMAQVRSLQTGRYQIMANNDGLSAVIDSIGTISASLPAFTSGILSNQIFPATGMTPWSNWGNWPILILCLLIIFYSITKKAIDILK